MPALRVLPGFEVIWAPAEMRWGGWAQADSQADLRSVLVLPLTSQSQSLHFCMSVSKNELVAPVSLQVVPNVQGEKMTLPAQRRGG